MLFIAIEPELAPLPNLSTC